MHDLHAISARHLGGPIFQQNNYYSGSGPQGWQRATHHPMQSPLYFGPRVPDANPRMTERFLMMGMLANYMRGGQQQGCAAQPTSPQILELENKIKQWEVQKTASGISEAARRNYQKKIDAARTELDRLRPPQNSQCAQSNPCSERSDPIRFMHMLYSVSRMFTGAGRIA